MDADNKTHLRAIVTEYGYYRTVEQLVDMAKADGFAMLSDALRKAFPVAVQADDTAIERGNS